LKPVISPNFVSDEIKEPFYYIKCGEFIVGTVRPETKCANSPLIVNPEAEYLRIKITSKSRGNLTANSKNINETVILVKNCFENEDERAKVLSLYGEDVKFEILEKFTGKELEANDNGFEASCCMLVFIDRIDAAFIVPDRHGDKDMAEQKPRVCHFYSRIIGNHHIVMKRRTKIS